MRKTVFALWLVLLAAATAALLREPEAAARGCAAGLEVCLRTIVPALFPFFVLSGLLSALDVPAALGQKCAPGMRRLFALPGCVAAPLLLGLCGGYPVGAAAAAELVRQGRLSREDAARALPLVNNTGPAFFIGALGSGVFSSAHLGLLLYGVHALSAVTVGLLFSVGQPRKGAEPAAPSPLSARSPAAALPEAVAGAVRSLARICGFAALFSALRGVLDALYIFPALTGAAAVGTGLELRQWRALLAGVLELGSGVGAMAGLAATPENLALASFVLGFGSLSVHCQTLAVTAEAEIKTARHFAGRLLHGALSALLTYGIALRLL